MLRHGYLLVLSSCDCFIHEAHIKTVYLLIKFYLQAFPKDHEAVRTALQHDLRTAARVMNFPLL